MIKKEKFWRFLQRLTIFDWLVILVVLAGFVFLALFIFKQEKWVKVEVKISKPYWFADKIQKADKQYDSLGRKITEVVDVRTYEWENEIKMIYLTLDLKTEVDKRKKRLKFNHQPLEIGKSIDLELGKIGTQALVTFIEGIPDTRVWEDKIVEVKVAHWSNIFPETLGMFPWRAEAIKIGNQMKDGQEKVIAEVLDKKVKPAEKIVTTADGQVLMRQDPIKKDVILTVKLKTFKQGGVSYYLDDFKVKIGNVILLALPNIDISPEITKILK